MSTCVFCPCFLSLLGPSCRSELDEMVGWMAPITLEIMLLEIPFSLGNPNIVFLKTRQAMIFINAMLGTLAGVRRIGGSELMCK